MDMTRSCYTTSWRFFDPSPVFGDSPVYTVRWYFCEPKAKTLPFAHCWGNTLWLDDWEKTDCPVGEIPYVPDHKWNNGRPPPGIDGTHFCGSKVDFRKPKEWSPALPSIPRLPNGVSFCCFGDDVNAEHGTDFFEVDGVFIVPQGIRVLYVQAKGGGAGGGGPDPIFAGGGGGGGAYAENYLKVIPGQAITVKVALTDALGDGDITWVSTTGLIPTSIEEGVLAVGGKTPALSPSPLVAIGGAGGKASDCIGTLSFDGGNGGNGFGVGNGGGGGQGCQGLAAGIDGGDATSTSNGSGGGSPGAGSGGEGCFDGLLIPGDVGGIPGGGGGGQSTLTFTFPFAFGAEGRVDITW